MSAATSEAQATLHGDQIQKPVENDITPSKALPGVDHHAAMQALDKLTDESQVHGDVTKSIHGHHGALQKVGWLSVMVPGIEDLAAKYHVGNYVVVRETGEKFFESMPIYAR
jgi:phosphatidylserine decarboxylase